MPNGIEKSMDERFLFINMYIAGEVRKLELSSGDVVAITAALGPDNTTWSQDGHLLVASHNAPPYESLVCNDLEAGACGYEYEIVRINPSDMSRCFCVHDRSRMARFWLANAYPDSATQTLIG